MDLLSLLKKMELRLAGQEKILEEMRGCGDGMAGAIECRVIGYKYAIDDIKIIMKDEFDKMAEYYGQE